MVGEPFTAAPRSLPLRFHQRPSSNRGPSARTLKSPAPRPALERAARKTNRPHISIWRVPAVRRAMSPEASAATDSSGLPRAAAAWARSLRQTAGHRRREHALPGGATRSLAREGAAAARTYMWGRDRHARRFRNASCERPRAWLRGEGGKRGGVKLEGEARVLSGAGRCTPDPLASRNNQVHRSMKGGSSLSAWRH